MDYKDLRDLARIAISADPKAPVAYSFGEEKFTLDQVNAALATEFRALAPDYRSYKENQNTIFRLIEETINEVLPARVEQQYMQFAEVKRVAQGDRAIFRQRITEAAKNRAKKNFVTRVGLAGRYEVFMLDGEELEVKTAAIGGAARIGFEEFLDGRIQFSDLTSLVLEGMDEYIYREIAKALEATVKSLPKYNRAEVAGFDEATMDELLAIGDAYGRCAIYCTAEFAAKMLPAQGWVSDNMKDALWANGMLGNYKGHQVIILPQSMVDETNTEKVIDPAQAYIMPVGMDKPVKLVFEGNACVRTFEDNDDWSTDFQTYQKFGIATFFTNFMLSYRNTDLKKDTRLHNLPKNQIDPGTNPTPPDGRGNSILTPTSNGDDVTPTPGNDSGHREDGAHAVLTSVPSNETIYVNDFASLQNAISDANPKVKTQITFADTINTNTQNALKIDKNISINLNGHNLYAYSGIEISGTMTITDTSNSPGSITAKVNSVVPITVTSGGVANISNISITAKAYTDRAIAVTAYQGNATCVLDNIKVEGEVVAINGVNGAATVKITSGTFTPATNIKDFVASTSTISVTNDTATVVPKSASNGSSNGPTQ